MFRRGLTTISSSCSNKKWMLRYTYVPNVLELRKPFRNDHLAHAFKAKEKGDLILGGAFANPTDGAAFVFQTDDPELIKEFIQKDPYVINGLVTDHTLREWTVVIS